MRRNVVARLQLVIIGLFALVFVLALVALMNSLLGQSGLLAPSPGEMRGLIVALGVTLAIVVPVAVIGHFRLRAHQRELADKNKRNRRIAVAFQRLSEFDNRDFSEFLKFCAESLTETCQCHTAMIAFFVPGSASMLQTRVFLSRGEWLENVTYDVAGTPCRNVLRIGNCYVDRDVANRYPDDHMFVEFGLEAYFGNVIVDADNLPIGMISIMSDVPTRAEEWLTSLISAFATRISIEVDRNRNFRVITQQKEKALITLNSIADGVIATDREARITSINPAAVAILSLHREQDWIGRPVSRAFTVLDADGDDADDPVALCLAAEKTVFLNGETNINTANQKKIAVQLSAAPILGDDERLYGAILILRDVSQERALRSELVYHANHDGLTGLANRRVLKKALAEATKQTEDQCHALCVADLDQFKVINDTCGHAAGDELLRQIANLFVEQVRGDDLVARLGGDEFALLLFDCDLSRVKAVTEKLRQAIESWEFTWEGRTFRLGISIGAIMIDASTTNTSSLMQKADAACFVAKDLGRNRVHVVDDGDEEVHQRQGEMRWVQRINEAMENNEFVLFVQPVSPLQDQPAPPQFEVLLRLRSTDSDTLNPPGSFIPAAERYGLSPRLDKWVVRNLLRLLVERPELSSDGQRYWVNLSGLSLGDAEFLAAVESAVKDSSLPRGTLNFEITETVVIKNVAESGAAMRILKELGCQFALDDFGSGVSSFGYLKSLPVDYIKIDGMYVRDVVGDPVDRIFVKSIIDIARLMGIKTIAEFVESTEIRDALASLGADLGQGFALGSPRPLIDTVTKFERSSRASSL